MPNIGTGNTQKKTPMRMCLGCRQMISKKDLVRVLRTNEGQVLIDMTGRKNGRGAYVCRNNKCLEDAIRTKAIERSLNISLTDEIYDSLRKEMNENE